MGEEETKTKTEKEKTVDGFMNRGNIYRNMALTYIKKKNDETYEKSELDMIDYLYGLSVESYIKGKYVETINENEKFPTKVKEWLENQKEQLLNERKENYESLKSILGSSQYGDIINKINELSSVKDDDLEDALNEVDSLLESSNLARLAQNGVELDKVLKKDNRLKELVKTANSLIQNWQGQEVVLNEDEKIALVKDKITEYRYPNLKKLKEWLENQLSNDDDEISELLKVLKKWKKQPNDTSIKLKEEEIDKLKEIDKSNELTTETKLKSLFDECSNFLDSITEKEKKISVLDFILNNLSKDYDEISELLKKWEKQPNGTSIELNKEMIDNLKELRKVVGKNIKNVVRVTLNDEMLTRMVARINATEKNKRNEIIKKTILEERILKNLENLEKLDSIKTLSGEKEISALEFLLNQLKHNKMTFHSQGHDFLTTFEQLPDKYKDEVKKKMIEDWFFKEQPSYIEEEIRENRIVRWLIPIISKRHAKVSEITDATNMLGVNNSNIIRAVPDGKYGELSSPLATLKDLDKFFKYIEDDEESLKSEVKQIEKQTLPQENPGEEYIKRGNACYDIINAYKEQNGNNKDYSNDESSSITSLLAFACESWLKGVCLKNGGVAIKGHDFFSIFEQLPNNIKSKISEKIDLAECHQNHPELKDAFNAGRYGELENSQKTMEDLTKIAEGLHEYIIDPNRLKAENEELKSKNNELKAENEELKRQNENQAQIIKKLQAENEELKVQNDRLQAENQEFKRQNENQTQTINKLHQMLSNALNFIERVKDSRVGKIFFRKQIKELDKGEPGDTRNDDIEI